MKSILTILALAIFAIIPAALADNHSTHKDMGKNDAKEIISPQVNAVIFYSDTCGSCKILEPKMMDAMAVINTDRINVVKLDFSNEATIEASKIRAKENNVGTTLQAYGVKTGFVVLVDNEGNEIGKISVDDSAEDIATKLTTAALSMKIAKDAV